MTESPVKLKPTSRVIDSLHSQIDELKTELEHVKVSLSEHKKKAAVLALKNELLVDQLANCKHENDMINAVLKRKERRIVDLEEQYNELSSQSDTLKLLAKNLKIRCDNLQESSASAASEHERLKIAYDAMVAAQNEYKRHYQEEIRKLGLQMEAYKANAEQELQELSEKLQSNDKDVDTLIESLTRKRKVMDNMYVSRNKTILEMVTALARAAKMHGEESRVVLNENLDTIRLLREKYPDLADKIALHEDAQVDLDDLVAGVAAMDTTLSDIEVPEESTKTVQRAGSTRRRRHKRHPTRASPEPGTPTDESEVLPRARNGHYSESRSASGDSTSSGRGGRRENSGGFGKAPHHDGNHISGQDGGNNYSNGNNASSNNSFNNSFNNSNGNSGQTQRNGLGSRQVSGNTQRGGRNRGPSFDLDLSRSGSRGLASSGGGKYKRRLFYGGSNSFNSAPPERKVRGDV